MYATLVAETEALEAEPLPAMKEPSLAAVRSQLGHILSSALFHRSERLSRFLRFIVEEKIAGQTAGLKEYTIATAVYDRGTSFNPATDTIVRVEARRLRSTLQKYYASEGRSDPVSIAVPKGSYEPVFGWKSSMPPERESNTRLSSVAVLPFEDLGSERDQEHFCEGISEEIMIALGQVNGLRVAARTSAFGSKSRYQDIRSIGKALNVGSVVEGTVRRAGDQMRITAQLINASNGYNLWSQRFDRQKQDAFAIQDDIAVAVADVCRRQIDGRTSGTS